MLDIANLHHRETGVRIAKVLPFENRYIVLLDDYEASQARLWANLRCLGHEGDLVWAASTPSSSDMFTDMAWHEGRLVARTWECFMITLDPNTGRILEQVFTK